jgi:hypothetical protein
MLRLACSGSRLCTAPICLYKCPIMPCWNIPRTYRFELSRCPPTKALELNLLAQEPRTKIHGKPYHATWYTNATLCIARVKQKKMTTSSPTYSQLHLKLWIRTNTLAVEAEKHWNGNKCQRNETEDRIAPAETQGVVHVEAREGQDGAEDGAQDRVGGDGARGVDGEGVDEVRLDCHQGGEVADADAAGAFGRCVSLDARLR